MLFPHQKWALMRDETLPSSIKEIYLDINEGSLTERKAEEGNETQSDERGT